MHLKIASRDELPKIMELGVKIWNESYPGIISGAQITYMLDKMYDPDRMAAMMDEGSEFAFIFREEGEEEPIGYASWQWNEEEKKGFLHRLYLVKEEQHQGIGSEVITELEEQAKKKGFEKLELRVNRDNTNAQVCYERNGFEVSDTVKTDIGEGFVMDDFLMTKVLV